MASAGTSDLNYGFVRVTLILQEDVAGSMLRLNP